MTPEREREAWQYGDQGGIPPSGVPSLYTVLGREGYPRERGRSWGSLLIAVACFAVVVAWLAVAVWSVVE